MERITSFSVDHTQLKKGVLVLCQDFGQLKCKKF